MEEPAGLLGSTPVTIWRHAVAKGRHAVVSL